MVKPPAYRVATGKLATKQPARTTAGADVQKDRITVSVWDAPKAKATPAKPATAPKPPHYLLVHRSTHFRLIGPFATQSAAAIWAKRKKNNPGDDPRWQTIQLEQAHEVPLIASPDAGPMPGN